MATPESKVKKQITRRLDQLGPKAWYFSPVSRGMGKHGVPDLICCINGLFVGIEVKAGKNEATKLQKLQLQLINDAGGLAVVCRDGQVDDLMDVLVELVHKVKVV